VGYISPILGADPFGPISAKIDRVVGVDDTIIQSNFRFNTFRGFRTTGVQNFHFPIDFAGHRYTSAAATAQPVIYYNKLQLLKLSPVFTVRRYALHGICYRNSVRLSVCPSVCLSHS